MFKASCVVAFGVLAVVILSGCSGTSHPVAPKPLHETSNSSAPVVASPSPSPSLKVVPVDEVPPGDPESWVPAGVPTKGPFQERGDEVPKFTRAMFMDTEVGAYAMADYYTKARNWSHALGEDSTPYLIICEADKCARDKAVAAQNRSMHRHVIGGRRHLVSSSTLDPAGKNADLVIQMHLKVDASNFVEESGKVVKHGSVQSRTIDLYLKWNGSMWRVTGEYLANR